MCLADTLARAGKLEEAETFCSQMKTQSVIAWLALLAGCRTHRDVERAERVTPIWIHIIVLPMC